ncbi:MAG TPA: sugar transferase [Terriglobia bacterium]|nr:sugar transferase [Terriglobia bacterium]
MVKILNQYFPGRVFLLLVTENVLIILGIWATVSLQTGRGVFGLLPDSALLSKVLLITVVCQTCLYFNDLYDLKSIRSSAEILIGALKSFGAASIILALIYTVVPRARFGRGVVETTVLSVALVILLWRVLIEWVHRLYGTGDRILVIGTGPHAAALTRQIGSRPDLHFRVLGLVSVNGVGPEIATAGAPYLGQLAKLKEIAGRAKPDRVVIALEERRQYLPMETLLRLRLEGVRVEYANTLYEKLTGRIPIDSIQPSGLVFSDVLHKSARSFFYRRVVGVTFALWGLAVLSPLLVLIAIAIKLDSPGPVLYRQARVGLDGHVFEILKFRSMRTDAESGTGPVWARKDDPRVTRVGRVLRKLRLDEVPQLINIVRGDMNFVGPRPERPYFVEKLTPLIPYYDIRHVIRPGVTGWAQVSCSYGSTVDEAKDKLEYDVFYIKNQSISLDLVILFQTLKIALFSRGAR